MLQPIVIPDCQIPTLSHYFVTTPCFVNYITFCSCSYPLMLTMMGLHWRCTTAWWVSSRDAQGHLVLLHEIQRAVTKLRYPGPENAYLEISHCTAIFYFLFIQFHSILADFHLVLFLLLLLASFHFMSEIQIKGEFWYF